MHKMNTVDRLNTRISILFDGGTKDQKDAQAIVQEFLEWYEFDLTKGYGKIVEPVVDVPFDSWRYYYGK